MNAKPTPTVIPSSRAMTGMSELNRSLAMPSRLSRKVVISKLIVTHLLRFSDYAPDDIPGHNTNTQDHDCAEHERKPDPYGWLIDGPECGRQAKELCGELYHLTHPRMVDTNSPSNPPNITETINIKALADVNRISQVMKVISSGGRRDRIPMPTIYTLWGG